MKKYLLAIAVIIVFAIGFAASGDSSSSSSTEQIKSETEELSSVSPDMVRIDDGTEVPKWIIGTWECPVEGTGTTMHCQFNAHGVVAHDNLIPGGSAIIRTYTYDGEMLNSEYLHLKVNHARKRLESQYGDVWTKIRDEYPSEEKKYESDNMPIANEESTYETNGTNNTEATYGGPIYYYGDIGQYSVEFIYENKSDFRYRYTSVNTNNGSYISLKYAGEKNGYAIWKEYIQGKNTGTFYIIRTDNDITGTFVNYKDQTFNVSAQMIGD